MYFAAPLPEETFQALVNRFNGLYQGRSLSEFVEILLNFVQTSFDINASIGMAMPRYRRIKPEVIRFTDASGAK